MAGAEAIVGLAIGVLPLLISAVEHYKSVYRPFRRWRKFHEELKRLDAELLVEKVKFHTECRILLGAVIGHNDAREMLEDPAHPFWRDSDLEAKMSSYLGTSANAWGSLIERTNSKLDAVKEKSVVFATVLRKSKEAEKRSGDGWRSKLGRKLDFSISGPSLSEDVSELRANNQNLHQLSNQVGQLFTQAKAESSGGLSQGAGQLDLKKSITNEKENSLSSTTPVDQCRLIQKTAIKLYNSLVHACTLHPEHSACFRLNSSQLEGTQLVRFDMMLKHILDERVVDEDPIWFVVESVLKECIEKAGPGTHTEAVEGALSEFTATRKRLNLSPPPQEQKRKKIARKKAVRFANDAVVYGKLLTAEISLPNLSQHRDFCKQVRRCCMQKPALGMCLGYLDKTDVCDHRVVFSPVSPRSRNPTSLANLISTCPSRNFGEGILIYEAIRLAKQLASAVLQFQATPLLKEDWASEDVVFFDMDNSTHSKSVTLTAPHLNVRIRPRMQESGVSAVQTSKKGLIRNPYTFALGWILIELAYQAPLRSLRHLTSVEGDENTDSNFHLADQVSGVMTDQLGLPYKKMVQKLIHCDFGAGFDLSEPDLQAVFHREVVCPLESLEKLFKELQIDS